MVINGRFKQREISGVERYAGEIASRLPGPARLISPHFRPQGVRGHVWEQAVLPRLVGKDVLWSPANTGPLLVANQVVTIHDTNAVEHPEWYRPGVAGWYRLLLPVLARRVRKVLTVSHYSRRRLIETLGLAPDRVAVIYPGVDPAQFHPAPEIGLAETLSRAGLSRPYLLFLGSLAGSKNLARLVQAWQQAAPAFPEVVLVIAGRQGPIFRNGLRGLQFRQLKLLGPVAEEDLASLYSGAEAFVLPSPWEGFGLTALEAMACGTPVIAADRGALPEVVGEAGVLVNALEIESLADAICKVLSDRHLRQELSQRGLERAASFSWERAAQAVYQTALDL